MLILLLLLLWEYPPAAVGLSCYHCITAFQYEGNGGDLTCVNEPWNVTGSVRTCSPHLKACRIARVEYKEKGSIQSFERGCSRPGEDSVEENANYVKYNRFCYTSLCNKGNGRFGEDESGKRVVAILVQDVRSCATTPTLVVACFFAIISVAFRYLCGSFSRI